MASAGSGAGRGRPQRSAAQAVTYNEVALSHESRPMYVDWKGDPGQQSNMSDDEYRAAMKAAPAAAAAAAAAAAQAAAQPASA
eukprot:SAG22_NODE_9315_length_596_cov_2.917505_1_plen_82_part_10